MPRATTTKATPAKATGRKPGRPAKATPNAGSIAAAAKRNASKTEATHTSEEPPSDPEPAPEATPTGNAAAVSNGDTPRAVARDLFRTASLLRPTNPNVAMDLYEHALRLALAD